MPFPSRHHDSQKSKLPPRTDIEIKIGAGIQIPPNSARLLHSWGLEAALSQKSVTPDGIIWRRWEDGAPIAHTRLNPEFQDMFEGPYYVTHRAHLHEVLHERAVQLGAKIRLTCRIVEYRPDQSSFVLENGSVIHADLIVAADGENPWGEEQMSMSLNVVSQASNLWRDGRFLDESTRDRNLAGWLHSGPLSMLTRSERIRRQPGSPIQGASIYGM